MNIRSIGGMDSRVLCGTESSLIFWIRSFIIWISGTSAERHKGFGPPYLPRFILEIEAVTRGLT